MKTTAFNPKSEDEVNNAEKLKQIAKRKEQNRNAQRRLRERKEEYTLQLEAQVAELHRRSQTQEEHSHYLREMLERIRVENQLLSQQLAMVTSSPEVLHRSSIDSAGLGVGVQPPVTFTRPRHCSESDTASSRGPCWGPLPVNPSQPNAVPQFLVPGALAPHETLNGPGLPQHFSGPPPASAVTFPPLLHPGPVPISRSLVGSGLQDQQQDLSRRGSASPLATTSEGMLSPRAARGCLNRYGSGQTDITIPSDGSDAEEAAINAQRPPPGKANGVSMEVENLDATVVQAVAVVGGRVDGLGSSQTADLDSKDVQQDWQASAANANPFMQTWQSSRVGSQQDLSLSNLPSNNLSSHTKPFGTASSGALGQTMQDDGWTISPWVNFTSSPLEQTGLKGSVTTESNQGDEKPQTRPSLAGRSSSLASRRGFSGKLQLQPPVLY
ncbi:DNA-binding transcription factor yap1 [Thecaphora frezii]